MPLLYLHGLWSGDFVPAPEQFLGSAAAVQPRDAPRGSSRVHRVPHRPNLEM